MNQETAKREMEKPVDLSKELLGSALKSVGQFGQDAFVDKQDIIELINATLEELFEMQDGELEGASPAEAADKAMTHLRKALEILQTGNSDNAGVLEATELLAKTLAVLYPISKLDESPSRIPDSPVPEGEDSPDVERRASPRINIEADIGFQSDTNFFMGFTEDISEGGLFIATYDTRNIGSVLSINFTLPDGHLVSAEGIVRWVREYNEVTPDIMPGMGIQFDNLPDEDKESIHRFTAERPPIFYDE